MKEYQRIEPWKLYPGWLPSGNLTVCYWKWPSRNSGFTQLENGGSFQFVFCMFTRPGNIQLGFRIFPSELDPSWDLRPRLWRSPAGGPMESETDRPWLGGGWMGKSRTKWSYKNGNTIYKLGGFPACAAFDFLGISWWFHVIYFPNMGNRWWDNGMYLHEV